jgi:hypothetical protein
MSMTAVESEGMTRKVVGYARTALKLVLIELLIPGGTLVILALLLMGSSALPIPEKVAPPLPFLKVLRRP